LRPLTHKTACAVRYASLFALAIAGASCTQVPLREAGTLRSYEGLATSGGTLTKARVRADRQALAVARTVRIVPTSTRLADAAGSMDPQQVKLVTNAIDRAVCVGLSERFRIVLPTEPADLEVHATVTQLVATNKTAAATSSVASLGASTVLSVPVPRLPIGLGGLAVEAEATAGDGTQKAAMLWARGANMLTTKPRASAVGDAYTLSQSFASEFSQLLVKGGDPYKGTIVTLPTKQQLAATMGASAKYEACKAFGPPPGLVGLAAGQIGLPPSWSDKGTAAPHR
jgi:Protein of unknown function (DUF3313)